MGPSVGPTRSMVGATAMVSLRQLACNHALRVLGRVGEVMLINIIFVGILDKKTCNCSMRPHSLGFKRFTFLATYGGLI